MRRYSKEGLIAAGLLSAAAFALGDLWAAALRSLEGPWLQNVGAAMEAVPSVLTTQGISAEPNALLGGSICFLAVWLAWAYLVRSQGNRRIGEEHGSARWGTKAEGLRFADTEDPFNNVILTESYGLAVDPGKRRGKRLEERPRNVLVIGGTGAGKTWRYSIPNILQMNADYFVIDSKGTQLPLLGNALVGSGYEISCMNLVRMSASAGVNPFSLIRDEVGIIEFAECFIANTTGDKDHVGDQFWVQAERLLYTALIGYLMFYCPSEDRTSAGSSRCSRWRRPGRTTMTTRARWTCCSGRSRRACAWWRRAARRRATARGSRAARSAAGRPRASDGCRSASRWAWTTTSCCGATRPSRTPPARP